MRLILAIGVGLTWAWLAAPWASADEAAEAAEPTPSSAAPAEATASAPEAEAPVTNIFLPAVPREEAPKPDSAPVINTTPRVAPIPLPPDAEKPEDFMFVTGIVREGDEMQVLVEDRRTGQAHYLKKGDALGQGVIVEIRTYDVTVKEWTVARRIPLGYSVSGKKDMYTPPPTSPSAGRVQSGRTGSPEAASGLPSWPGRQVWEQWSSAQRKEYLDRRRQAWQRQQQERERSARQRR